MAIQKKRALVVIEAPGKVQKIQKYLGNDYLVKASVGHILDLPQKSLGIDVKNDFKVDYQPLPNKKDTIRDLKRLAADVDEVYLFADLDREGEMIAWSVKQILDRKGLTFKRISATEITEKGCQAAIKAPRDLDENLIFAQRNRRILDRLTGFKLSPLLWRHVGKGTSAGRVQSCALKIIVERQKEIDKFVPEDYYTIDALVEKDGDKFEAKYHTKKTINDKEFADTIVKDAKKGSWVVKKVEKKQSKKKPDPPFVTASLQQSASSLLGWDTKKSMQIAQQLYENGKITYHRSDSYMIAADALKVIRKEVEKVGSNYLPTKAWNYANKKNAQAAHECIRPTDASVTTLKGSSPAEHVDLYELIWKRTVASQMKEAVYDQMTIDLETSGHPFRASGSTMSFSGYRKVWDYSDAKEVILPMLTAGDDVNLLSIKNNKHTTKPPARFNDASLVKELDHQGVGRPSTYSSIIETLLGRKYLKRVSGKAFEPTDLGHAVSDWLTANFSKLIAVDFTALMEEKLDEVEQGKLNWKDQLNQFYKEFSEQIKQMEEQQDQNREGIDCPKCSDQLFKLQGPYGAFYAHPKTADCKMRADKDGKIKEPPKDSGKKCSKCKKPLFVRKGPSGEFLGCSGFPKCRNTEQIEN